jgi:S1-C subfamily serine protease
MKAFRALFLLGLPLLALSYAAAAAADEPKSAKDRPRAEGKSGAASQAKTDKDAEALLSAIVQIRMKAIPDAHSSETLGESREGTGVVIDTRGHIVTIGYIVIEADAIEITTRDDKTFPATLVGYDHASGFGLLHASLPSDVKPMQLGDASELGLRQPVLILPAGGREAAALAYVVSKRMFTGSWEYLLDSAIFTAPAMFQWAGAALVNRDGKLVGVGSLLVRDSVESGSPLPGNMFVPIDLLKPILNDLIAKGRRSGAARPWLGVATEAVEGRLVVTRVSPDGPGDKAGIQPGDLVVGVAGESVSNHEQFYRKVWSLGAAGAEIPLKVVQGTELHELKVRSIDRFQYFKEKPAY